MDNKFKRRENESDKEYQLRLSIMKLIDNEDIDWEEIKGLLNSDKHRDTLRREGYGLIIAHDIYEHKINELNKKHNLELFETRKEVDKEIENKKIKKLKKETEKFEKERIKMRDQRNDLNAMKRDIARVENIVEQVKYEILKLNELKPLIPVDTVVEINKDKEGIILLSDLHIGAYCDNILDMYNPDICKLKLEYYINRVIEEIKFRKIDKIYFLVAGDVISGLIHTTTRLSNALNIVQQVVFASELLAEAIFKVSKIAKVGVGILAGNHCRIQAQKELHVEGENFTEFIREMVKLRLIENKNVVILDPQDSTLLSLDIKGNSIALVHGNLDGKSTINRLIELNKTVYDIILQGHWHKFDVTQHNHTMIITNGFFGGEEYSKDNRLYNKPHQLFLTISEDGIEELIPINLNKYNKKQK